VTQRVLVVLLFGFAGIVALILSGYAWKRREIPGGAYFAVLMLAVSWWGITNAAELAATQAVGKVLWSKLSYVSVTSTGLLFMLFAAHYSRNPGWLATRRAYWLWSVPILVTLLAATNELHGLVWPTLTLAENNLGVVILYGHGPAVWLIAAYSYLVLLYGSITLLRTALRSADIYRWQAVLLVIGAVLPWIGNFLYLSGLNPLPGIDLTPLGFTLTGVLVAVSIFRYQLLDLLPVAYDHLFENLPDAVLVLDVQQRVVGLNPAARHLFEQKQLEVGKLAQEWLKEYPSLCAMVQQGRSGQLEVVWAESTWMEARFVPLREERGRLAGQLLLLRDITVRKEAERQLVEMNRMKTQLLANVSHDLRTPLGSIIGFADMLREQVFGELNQEQKSAAREIIDSANQLLAFIENLIGQAQIESGRVVMHDRPFLLRDLMDVARNSSALAATKKGIALIIEADPAVPEVLEGDFYWLRQVLSNLLGNAIKFTDRGEVRLHIFCPDAEHWAMKVSDTGIGIAPELQQMIFEPFRQVDESRTRPYSGSGLGLSIVSQLVKMMKGTLLLESTLEQGSIFTVILPLKPEKQDEPKA
jgi:PAS domain S-box-containing protein